MFGVVFIMANVDGQSINFSGYGGIEEPLKYMRAKYGDGWIKYQNGEIEGVSNFRQSVLEKNSNNCTLASITRILKYYSDIGYTRIPNDTKDIYSLVREVGVRHGFDPQKTGILRDLFVYTPWEIDNMMEEAWRAFGYSKAYGDNVYLNKLATIKSNIDNKNPLLLNIASGDYKDHSVCIFGYIVFSKKGYSEVTLLKIYDGWSESIRYIDWNRLGLAFCSVTKFLPSRKQ